MMAVDSLTSLEGLLMALGVSSTIPAFPDSDVLYKPSDIHRAYLAETASKLLDVPAALAYESVQVRPAANAKDNSDLDLVLPKLKLKSSKPKQIAHEVSNKFVSTPLFQRPVADGVHLRFFFSHQTLPQLVLHHISSQWAEYGSNVACAKRDLGSSAGAAAPKVVVDFSRPKLASKFTLANLRSTVVGSQIANLHQSMGWDVVKLNYLGDWGKDLGLLAVGWGRFGSEEVFQTDPMGHVLEVYEKINELFKPEKEASRLAREETKDAPVIPEIETQGLFAERDASFKRMEDGDPDEVALWKRIRDVSIENYAQAYARLNTTFDEFSGESQVSPESIKEVESILKEKGYYEEADGSWTIDFAKHGQKGLGVAFARDRSGSTSYLLRDIAAVLDRAKKHSFDRMVYVVDQSQDAHFQKVFQALRFMGRDDLADKLEHINLGKVVDKSPQPDKVQLLGDIVDQAASAVREELGTEQGHLDGVIDNTDATVAVLGVTGLITQDALNKRSNSYAFSYKDLASFDQGAGFGLQVAYAKLHAKVGAAGAQDATLDKVDYTFLQEESCMEVLRLLMQYPEITAAAYKAHEPSLVMTYLLRLTEELEEFLYDETGDDEDEGGGEAVEDGGPEAAEPNEPDPPEKTFAEAVLFKHVLRVLANGLRLLGISPVVG
ncbi:uncharacterized protein B0I36DRAFT_384628 [Microdochium trichocladiopsis]|uniref:arginine--tRNA ligase n=1 Tax=Microdochium trichocladiopsis TaxID=1682393 RepID=A0A9P9BLX1_9PEZI|nr:uncharacterized protein B0I36DRAFT_384628 [Microdochium trichocladiopsis]KAH7029033.1 hypothetical protein B0I36DRAFT_384628 [Microdochium trichocladiopsis]